MTDHDAMRRIGRALRQERLAANCTATRLAREITCSKAYLSLMESGQRSISIEHAHAIEKALNIRDGRFVDLVNWHRTPTEVRKNISSTMRRQMRPSPGSAAAPFARRQPRKTLREFRRMMEGRTPLDRTPGAGGHGRPRRGRRNRAPRASRSFRGGRRRGFGVGAGLSIPLVNTVAMGYPRQFTDLDYPATVAHEYIACPDVRDPDAFAARVVGDSMEPEYREGDIVVFSPMLDTPPGCDCFIRFEGGNETTFKRVYFENDRRTIRVQPLNNAHPPQFVDREDVAGMYVAVYVMRRVKHGANA